MSTILLTGLMILSATMPFNSLQDGVKSMAVSALDVLRGSLSEYDFARLEIGKVWAHVEQCDQKHIRVSISMEGNGKRRLNDLNAQNDKLWSASGLNTVKLSVTLDSYTDAKGLSSSQYLVVTDELRIINLQKPFRYLVVAPGYEMRVSSTGKPDSPSSEKISLSTLVRAGKDLSEQQSSCIIVHSN